MSTPPRTIILDYNGAQMYAELPPSLEKAVALAVQAYAVPSSHGVKLFCSAKDLPPYDAGGKGDTQVGLADDTSYYYACMNKYIVTLGVHVFEKEPGKGGDGGKEKAAPKKEEPKITTAKYEVSCETTAGKAVATSASLTGELGKGPGDGKYVGVLTKENQAFAGRQLGPNEELTKIVVHDAGVVRLLFRPRSMRSNIDVYTTEDKSLEVIISVKGWSVTSAYPSTTLHDDAGRTTMRWFLRVKPGGVVQDLLSGIESGGLFFEMLPTKSARPPTQVDAEGPLNPTYPDLRPTNGWCLPRDHFLPHIDRVLQNLGLPAESRSAMITGWLPSVMRHSHIAYRILQKKHIEPTSHIYLCPEPDVLIRIFVLFRGVPESELKEWNNRELTSSEMGTDWRDAVGHTPAISDDGLFRVIEYGGMEVFDYC